LVFVAASFGAAIIGNAAQSCSERYAALEPRSKTIANLARGTLQDPPTGGGVVNGAMRVGEAGTPRRVEYREDGELIGIDRFGSDAQLARRDVFIGGRVRAYEFFTNNRLVRRQIIADDASILCTDRPRRILPPLPFGKVY
jgi:hypothetical protein